ncbi:hypothetical protein PAMP_004308 [Pampus punctatissimus]
MESSSQPGYTEYSLELSTMSVLDSNAACSSPQLGPLRMKHRGDGEDLHIPNCYHGQSNNMIAQASFRTEGPHSIFAKWFATMIDFATILTIPQLSVK